MVVVIALAFDFTNGFHDTANAMATTISTRALPPRVAVLLAGVMNFIGAFLSIKVAATIANNIVDAKVVSSETILAVLIGAIGWNLITWYFTLPSSSSHALIGGLIGAALVEQGVGAVQWSNIFSSVLIPAAIAPVVAAIVAGTGAYLAYRMIRNLPTAQAIRDYRWGQIGSSSLVALAHGTNDAQKTMGIITLALVAGGYLQSGGGFYVPLWVIVSAATAMALGTYIGGWRIIRTLGNRVVDIEAPQGFAAESVGAAVILSSAAAGYPLSTTHVVCGGVLGSGVGRFKRLTAVNWGIAGNIVAAWIFTLLGAGLIAAAAEAASLALGGGFLGSLPVVVVAAIGAAAIYIAARRSPVTADNVNQPDVAADKVTVAA
jgi:PiT family inorganic phosphate transporter